MGDERSDGWRGRMEGEGAWRGIVAAVVVGRDRGRRWWWWARRFGRFRVGSPAAGTEGHGRLESGPSHDRLQEHRP